MSFLDYNIGPIFPAQPVFRGQGMNVLLPILAHGKELDLLGLLGLEEILHGVHQRGVYISGQYSNKQSTVTSRCRLRLTCISLLFLMNKPSVIWQYFRLKSTSTHSSCLPHPNDPILFVAHKPQHNSPSLSPPGQKWVTDRSHQSGSSRFRAQLTWQPPGENTCLAASPSLPDVGGPGPPATRPHAAYHWLPHQTPRP